MLAKVVILSQPLDDVGRVEGLWPEALGVNSSADEGPNHVVGVLLLRVAMKWHWDGGRRSFELRGEVAGAWERVHKGYVAVERREGAILVYLSRRISDIDLGLRINLGNEIAEVRLQNLKLLKWRQEYLKHGNGDIAKKGLKRESLRPRNSGGRPIIRTAGRALQHNCGCLGMPSLLDHDVRLTIPRSLDPNVAQNH